MKTLLQYLVAAALIILGIILLLNPLPPAETTSQIQTDQGSHSQLDRQAFRPTMRLA